MAALFIISFVVAAIGGILLDRPWSDSRKYRFDKVFWIGLVVVAIGITGVIYSADSMAAEGKLYKDFIEQIVIIDENTISCPLLGNDTEKSQLIIDTMKAKYWVFVENKDGRSIWKRDTETKLLKELKDELR